VCCESAARDAFKSFDKKSEDKIRVGDIEAAMKRIGHNIKPDWLEKIEHMIDAEGLPTSRPILIAGAQFRQWRREEGGGRVRAAAPGGTLQGAAFEGRKFGILASALQYVNVILYLFLIYSGY